MYELQSHGQCSCGENQFTLLGEPLFRCLCHCTICQRYNQAAYGDVSVFRAQAVELNDDSQVGFRAHRSPKILQRGLCQQCQKPVIERLNVPLMPKLAIVPNTNIAAQEIIPAPACHIFYDRRVADIDDDLPKHSGYFPSEAAFTYHLLKAL